MFTLTIRQTNEAFADGRAEHVTAELLRETADRLDMGELEGPIYDPNGNRVGAYKQEQSR